jgi:hypothetical protein
VVDLVAIQQTKLDVAVVGIHKYIGSASVRQDYCWPVGKPVCNANINRENVM